MNRKNTLLNKQGSKRFNVYNMRPFVKLTKKQYRSTTYPLYVFALEYKKKLYRQNLIHTVLYNSFKHNMCINTLDLQSQWKEPRKGLKQACGSFEAFHKKSNPILIRASQRLRAQRLRGFGLKGLTPVGFRKTSKARLYLSSTKKTPFILKNTYSAFLNGYSLWAIQKQTTARKVFSQTSVSWLYSLDYLESSFCEALLAYSNIQQIKKKAAINRKNKLWTAGFVRIRKLRQYYARQLISTHKILYWYNYPSSRKINMVINTIYNHIIGPEKLLPSVWSIISYLDSLWPNIMVKSNLVYNSSASINYIKSKKTNVNGFILNKPFTISCPGDIITYKK